MNNPIPLGDINIQMSRAFGLPGVTLLRKIIYNSYHYYRLRHMTTPKRITMGGSYRLGESHKVSASVCLNMNYLSGYLRRFILSWGSFLLIGRGKPLNLRMATGPSICKSCCPLLSPYNLRHMEVNGIQSIMNMNTIIHMNSTSVWKVV